jgi:hypothetical protein
MNHNLVAMVIIVALFPLRYVLMQTKEVSMEYVCYDYWVFSVRYALKQQKQLSNDRMV